MAEYRGAKVLGLLGPDAGDRRFWRSRRRVALAAMDRNPSAGVLVVPTKNRNSLTIINPRQPIGHEGQNDGPNGMKGVTISKGRLGLLVPIWSFWA